MARPRAVPGEHPAGQIIASTYESTGKVVAEFPIVKGPRWSRFLVDSGPLGDKLIAALETGPVKVKPFGLEGYTLDLDQIERPR